MRALSFSLRDNTDSLNKRLPIRVWALLLSPYLCLSFALSALYVMYFAVDVPRMSSSLLAKGISIGVYTRTRLRAQRFSVAFLVFKRPAVYLPRGLTCQAPLLRIFLFFLPWLRFFFFFKLFTQVFRFLLDLWPSLPNSQDYIFTQYSKCFGMDYGQGEGQRSHVVI